MNTMKILLLAALTLVLSLSLSCKDSRVDPLEQRLNLLEQRLTSEGQRATQLDERLKVLEAKPATNLNESMKQVNLESCISQANADFEKGIITNGTKTSNGTYTAPAAVQTNLEKQKQSKTAACRAAFSK